MSGSPFTAPRHENRRTWVYRIRPSVVGGLFKPIDNGLVRTAPLPTAWSPNPQRWSPFAIPAAPKNWVEGLTTLAANGDPALRTGMAMHVYLCNTSMERTAFFNLDGEMIIVPQQGSLRVVTELGVLDVAP
jgi:homogentisate 1,2-dioxygenase